MIFVEGSSVPLRKVALAACGFVVVTSLVWIYVTCFSHYGGMARFPSTWRLNSLLKPPSKMDDQDIAECPNCSGNETTIWFVESSNETCLKGRQACSIESAALRNPSANVVLLTTGQILPECHYYRALTSLPNFHDVRLNLTDIFSDTPLESWYRSRNWTRGPYAVEDLSDAIRLVVLWKRGGIYLDLDFILLKDVSELKNSLVFEVVGQPTNSALFIDRGHPFLEESLAKCAELYDASRWGSCGPSLMARMYHSWRTKGPGRSPVQFLGRDTFFVVGYDSWVSFFEPGRTSWVFEVTARSYGVHLWNKLSHGMRVVAGSGTALDVLARFNCPVVYEVMMDRGFF